MKYFWYFNLFTLFTRLCILVSDYDDKFQVI